MNSTENTKCPQDGRHHGGLWLRRPARYGAAVLPLACVLLFAGRAAVQAAAGGRQPQSAVSSPSDTPAAPQQPAQPAVCAAKSAPGPGCVVYQYWRCRPRGRLWCCPVRPSTPPTAAAEQDASAKTDPYAWKTLFDGKTLNGWKSAEFGGEGKVSVEGGMIVMEMGNSMTGVTYTGAVPRDNYELTLEGMRLEGADFFCTTTFPVGKDCCSLVMGGWGGTVVGLSTIDYYDASENPTTTFQAFKDNQWYRVRIRVTQPKIEAWVDGEQVVDQERQEHKIGIRMEVDLCQPLGIATWSTKGAVRNIRIRQLPPEAAAADESAAR